MTIMWTEAKLKQVADMMANYYWPDLELDYIIKIGTRSKKRRGQFRRRFNDKTWKHETIVEVADFVIKCDTTENMLSTLKHELCHYAGWKMNKPYYDGDKWFEDELKRIGSHSTGTMKQLGEIHVCKCSTCGEEFKTKAKATRTRWVTRCKCPHCKGKIYFSHTNTIVNEKVITAADEEDN